MNASHQRGRRALLQLGLGGALGLAFRPAAAQAYPTRSVTIIVPFPPGGSDTLLRLMAPALQAALGQPVVIDYLTGASGLIGSERVARAPADGYTLLFAASTAVTATVLYKNSRVDMLRDFVPIMNTHEVPQVVIVHPDVKATSMAELIALLKARPDSIAYGSAGNGSTQHLNGELIKAAAGIKMLHVPFKGIGPMLAEILAGRVPVATTTITQAQSYIAAGKLRALAVLDSKRSPYLNGVPAITETLPGFSQSDSWSCILAPAGTPTSVRDRVLQALRQTLENRDVRSAFTQNFAYITALGPKETEERIRAELERTRNVMKIAGIEAE